MSLITTIGDKKYLNDVGYGLFPLVPIEISKDNSFYDNMKYGIKKYKEDSFVY